MAISYDLGGSTDSPNEFENIDDDYQFEEWKKSPEYIDYVNEQIEQAIPKYSDSQIDNAIRQAFKCIKITSEEVGVDVYEKLFRQHFFEYLV